MKLNIPVIPILRNFRPTLRRTTRIKLQKMSVPFAPSLRITRNFGQIESAHRVILRLLMAITSNSITDCDSPDNLFMALILQSYVLLTDVQTIIDNY